MAIEQVAGSKLEEILGADAAGLLEHQCKTIPKENLQLPGPDYVDRAHAASDRPTRVLSSLQSLLDHGRLGRHRVRVDSPGRPGHRAFGRRVVRAQPDVLRPGEHRQAGDRRRLQRRRLHAGRARRRGAEVRAQDSVPAQVEPQRVPLVSERVRSDPVRQRQAGLRDGGDGRRRDDLFRIRGVEAADSGSDRDVPAGARAGHVHGPLVLSAKRRVQDQGNGLPRRRRPDRPGQPPRRDDRSRHHQAEAAREQRRVHRRQFRQDAQEGLLGAHDQTIRST